MSNSRDKCRSFYYWCSRQPAVSLRWFLWCWEVRTPSCDCIMVNFIPIKGQVIPWHNNFQYNPMKFQSSTEAVRFKPTHETTIAELNKVSIRETPQHYHPNYPLRISLPEYFNIPSFKDQELGFSEGAGRKVAIINKEDAVFRKRMKDLAMLAEGMKRAKNIKEESRYYFTQGVLLHNTAQYLSSIEYFEKFLKIVIYLQDLKSVELAFNVIGCAYMCVGEYNKSIEFHSRQGQASDRADTFISILNTGLCQELLGNHKLAFSLYQQAEQVVELSEQSEQRQERLILVSKLTERTGAKAREGHTFVTEQNGTRSPQKWIENSLLKEESSLLMQKYVPNRKEYEKNKMKYAIHAAEENMEKHVRSSIKYESLR